MKKLLSLAALLAATALPALAQPVEITHWDFNSAVPDGDNTTGSFEAAINRDEGVTPRGNGTSRVVNANYRFANSVNEDPWRFVDQSALRMQDFPGTSLENKSAGTEFLTSTVGFERIKLKWLQNNSSSASKYWRVQYTGDSGTTWIDHHVMTNNTTAWRWFQDKVGEEVVEVDLSGVRAADNNPNFGFRIVAEFQGTAIGTGGGYAPNGHTSYLTSGTFWLDLVTVAGDPVDASNAAPTISLIAAQDTNPGVPTQPVPFAIGDADQSVDGLVVTWSTWTPHLVQNVVFAGTGSDRTVTVTPTLTPGVATIVIRVTDNNGEYSESLLVVSTHNLPPADAVAFWDFNGEVQDSEGSTGSFVSRVGSGTAQVVGATHVFQASATTDPWVVDNSAVRMSGFPAVNSNNKSAGIEFRFSTVGYEGITATYQHNNNASASRYYRVQYTPDGSIWLDHKVIVNATSGWNTHTIDFAGIRAADNNPNFGFRLVTEFESTATGTGNGGYVASQGTGAYTSGGTFWVELAEVKGSPLGGSNTAPNISNIAPGSVRVNNSTPVTPFVVNDVETAGNDLVLSWTTSTPGLIQGVQFGGSGSDRTITVTATDIVGTATVFVRVTDANGKYSETPFVVTIRPTNTPPIISNIQNLTMLANTTADVHVTISDEESIADNLLVTIESSDPRLISSANVVVGGSGADRILALTPIVDQAGGAWMTVTVSDGMLTASTSFMLKVIRPDTLALWNFNSPEADANTGTGNEEPAVGTGTASPVGTATNSLGGLSAASFDPELLDNTKWRFGSFPLQGEGNKSSGAQFMLSTEGYQNIAVSWDHYNSATGSKYWKLQYTLDGVNFIDYTTYTNPVVTLFRPTGASFASIPGANDNPNFGIRIVSEFESTATGVGSDVYVPVNATSTYSTGGTLWLDMVSFTGDLIGSGGISLSISNIDGQVVITWPASAPGALQSTGDITSAVWQNVAVTPEVVGGFNQVQIPASAAAQFYRLGE